ncbi:FMN-binding protein [Kitasatospora mediocidica]|uniref:FMN-binding protein n=1 Tax=Kitasatospora mediocidica TaxID=58352 RepID=UPI00055EDEA2|nr:FMN-binding protein [Kitasatospora mediocidica]
MRKTTMALLATSAGLALVIGAKVESATSPHSALVATSGPPGAQSPAGGSSTNPGAPTAAAPSGGTSTPGSAGASAGGRFTGSVVDTRYGPVQVQAVLTAGKITDITVLQQTTGGHSSQIDSYALPQLKAEALQAQSANIDVVSGATYTSDGYAQSLQAALDAAHR